MPDKEYAIRMVHADHELEQACLLETKVFSEFGTDNPPEIVRSQNEIFPDGFVVAIAQGKLVGYASSEKWPELRAPKMGEDPRDTHDKLGKVLCITTMVVDETWRGCGIGAAMLKYFEALATAHGCHTIVVETPRTRSFYEQHGFTLHSLEEDRELDVAVLTKSV